MKTPEDHESYGQDPEPSEETVAPLRVGRNLHLWLLGGLFVLVVPMVLFQFLRTPTEADAQRLGPDPAAHAQALESGSLAPVREVLAEQALSVTAVGGAAMGPSAAAGTIGPARPAGGAPPPLPPLAPQGSDVLVPPPPGGAASADMGEASQGQDSARRQALAQEEAQRQAAARASPILAVSAPAAAAAATAALPAWAGDVAPAHQRGPVALAGESAGPGGLDELASGIVRGVNRAPEQQRRWIQEQGQVRESAAPLRPRRAESPYTVVQGTVIPAVLITEVNSDLPGPLSARVTQDVYDSILGQELLIPKGARLVGEYNSDVRPGQERLLAAFSRLIYPSGASVDLSGMPAADARGRTGLADQVDDHFLRVFGSSMVVAALGWLTRDQTQTGSTLVIAPGTGATSAMAGAAGQILLENARVMLERNRAIPPTVIIRQGQRLNLLAQRDLILPPVQVR